MILLASEVIHHPCMGIPLELASEVSLAAHMHRPHVAYLGPR